METDKKYFMYVLLCEGGTLYTGFTTNVARRFSMHQSGRGAKYTRSHRPIKILFTKRFITKHDALSAEYAFKQLSHAQKIAYITTNGQ